MLKIGVCGAGYLGKIHIQQWKEINGIELVGFYDPNENNAKEAENKFNTKSYKSEDELIANCNAIDIVTITKEHFRIAEKCLLAGKHVFIEKPVTETLNQAEKLLELEKSTKLKIQIGHIERFNPTFKVATAFGLHPMFIESHRLAEFSQRGTDVSVILDLMIHDIDIVLKIVKSPVKFISASGVSIVSGNPDIANARIEFENGCTANLTASRISLRKERKMRIFQRDAYILVDFLNKITEKFSLEDEKAGFNPFQFVIDTGRERKAVKMDKPTVPSTNAMRAELESFANAIIKNTPTEVSLTDGYNALKLAHLVLDQIKEKEEKFLLQS
ncbi:MAG: Gfo/Idh/MocA family oxidoreductase [Bacteroidota bacterium]|nr:Gfo/Idh/MocA family oxidoreductase [Bacteroidota bacterium]